jgi:hypothetical protein
MEGVTEERERGTPAEVYIENPLHSLVPVHSVPFF